MTGHVPEFGGHDAETAGHDGPKYALKRWWGANNLWQQSRRVLELWMQVRSTGYALMQRNR